LAEIHGFVALLVCCDFLLGDVGRKKKIKSDRSLEIYSDNGGLRGVTPLVEAIQATCGVQD
jgi:hypothetical protein